MEKINIAELLKDCPIGMELDCTMYDSVEFMEVDTESDTIILRVGNKFIRRLNKYGQDDIVDYAKCVIFPKGKTTWEGFVPPLIEFKDGDVIVDKYGAVAIYKRVHSSYEEPYVDFHCGITSEDRSLYIKDSNSLQHCGKIDSIRFATEEEKQELFQAIKDKGYHWNPETKTLEVIQPKFKDGDVLYIRSVNTWICIYKEGGEIANVYYKYVATTYSKFVYDDLPICNRDHVREIRLATEEEKQELFNAIIENGY